MARHHDPYFDEGMRGWLLKQAARNYWRIAGFDAEDLFQEGLVCFYKCKQKYPELVRKRFPTKAELSHFMALVKTTFTNRITDMAMTQSPVREPRLLDVADEAAQFQYSKSNLDDQTVLERFLSPEDEVQTVGSLLQSAPSEIKQLFQLLIDDALELSGYRRFGHPGRNRRPKRETNNQYYSRLLGLPPDRNIEEEIKRHFLVK